VRRHAAYLSSGTTIAARAPPLSGWPGTLVHYAFGVVRWREAEPVPDAGDTLRMPDRIDQVMGDGAALGLPGDGNDARPDRHVKGVRG